MMVMVPLAGIDPRLVLLAVAGLAATAFVLGAISILVSIGARDTRRALVGAIRAGSGGGCSSRSRSWCTCLEPGRPARWVYPVAIRLVESSPMGVLTNLIGLARRGGAIDAVAKMIGYEMVGGVLLVAWAVARLRPASRAAAEGRSGGLAGPVVVGVAAAPSPCGDDALLWKEMFVLRSVSLAARIDYFLTPVFFLGGLGFVAYRFARPAWFEAMDHGYGPGPGTAWDANLVPSLFLRLATGGEARAGPGAGGVQRLPPARHGAVDRDGSPVPGPDRRGESDARAGERDTWLGLLATPLSGGDPSGQDGRRRLEGAMDRRDHPRGSGRSG